MVMKQNPIVGIGPEHAQLISSAGWTKNDLRQALWEQTRIPLSAWPADCSKIEKFTKKGERITSESMIPITSKPEGFLIVIAGGAGKHSHYFPPFPGCFPVSKLVTK